MSPGVATGGDHVLPTLNPRRAIVPAGDEAHRNPVAVGNYNTLFREGRSVGTLLTHAPTREWLSRAMHWGVGRNALLLSMHERFLF